MKNEIKCYKCGKIHEIAYKDLKETISCSHCHQQMRINERSEKKYKLVRYIFIFVICLFLAFLLNIFSVNYFLMLFVILSLMLVFAQYADKVCLILTDMIFGLQYEEYHPVVKSKKEIRKERDAKDKKKKKKEK